MSNKEPWLAVNLSIILAGAGQVYSGKTAKGIFLGLVNISSIVGLILFVIKPSDYSILGLSLILVSILIYLWNILDAYKSAKKGNTPDFENKRKKNKDAWLAALLSRIEPGLGHLYIGKTAIGFTLMFISVIALVYFQLIYLVILTIISPLVAYHAYMAAPIRREYSRKPIVKFTIFTYIVPIIFPFILGLFIRTHIAEPRWIPSGSMQPALNGTVNQWEADKVTVDKIGYKFNNPKRGDIVVFSPTEALRKEQFQNAFIKRIVGLPGEKVELKKGKVYINDKPLEENYVASGQLTSTEVCTSAPTQPYLSSSVTIPPNSYLVLGDNRESAYDSRCWGVVPKDNIIGKASAIFWPIERRRSL